MTGFPERVLVGAAGLAGAAGVGLSAAAAHLTGGGSLEIAARFLLIHAAALIGVAALLGLGFVGRRRGIAAALVIVVGLVLFSGDLSVRALAGIAPVPMAAPTGGTLLIGGWLLLAVAAVPIGRRVGLAPKVPG